MLFLDGLESAYHSVKVKSGIRNVGTRICWLGFRGRCCGSSEGRRGVRAEVFHGGRFGLALVKANASSAKTKRSEGYYARLFVCYKGGARQSESGCTTVTDFGQWLAQLRSVCAQRTQSGHICPAVRHTHAGLLGGAKNERFGPNGTFSNCQPRSVIFLPRCCPHAKSLLPLRTQTEATWRLLISCASQWAQMVGGLHPCWHSLGAARATGVP